MKLLFVSFDNFLGRLSRISTKCEWSHVDIVLEVEDRQDMRLIGAMKDGVSTTTLSQRLAGPRKVRAYRVDEVKLINEEAAHKFLLAQIGKPYDKFAVLAFAMPWRVNWDDENKWFCSELAAAAIEHGGVPLSRYHRRFIHPGFLDSSPLLKTIEGPTYL